MICDLIGWCALSASEQAAWVQAVGSVAAIFSAIGIAAYERGVAKREAAARRLAESDARYTRANRAMTRFQKLVLRQLDLARKQQEGNVAANLKAEQITDEMKDLERECHLMPVVGGECLTAIRFFDDAQDLIVDSLLLSKDAARFADLLGYANDRIESALKLIFDYLWDAQSRSK